jgi:hypothetical protein
MSIPTKTTPTCSNIFLIDENLCVGNSLNTINHNVASLSSALVFLENYQNNWFSLYSTFQTYSAIWVDTVTNVQNFSANWVSTSNTVVSLSSTWNVPFTVFYPTILPLSAWGVNQTYNSGFIKTWLTNNFSPLVYNLNQVINVTVYLNQILITPVVFNKSYAETCIPNCKGLEIDCKAGSCPPLYYGCNHHGGQAGSGACNNGYSYCTQTSNTPPQKLSCTAGSGARTLSISLNISAVDINTAQTINLSFTNINNTWQ